MGSIQDPPDRSAPPEPPELPRRVRMYPMQWVGIPVLFLLPVVALFGVFGDTRARAESATPALQLLVEYSDRLRHGQRTDLRIEVRNLTDRTLDTVTVAVDRHYIAHFADVTFTPQPLHAYELVLLGLRPGESRSARAEMEGRSSWRTRGRITATGGGGTAAVQVSTFVFP